MEGPIVPESNPQEAFARLAEKLDSEPPLALPENFTVLDHLLFGIVQEGASPSLALEAYKNLANGFFNFNEMRVAHRDEFIAMLEGVPNAADKAQRMLDVLKFVFETTYSFDLESMKKKPVKQAQKQLSKVAGATRFAVAATVQRALGGTAPAIDENGRALLVACGAASADEPFETVLAQIEGFLTDENAASICLAIQEAAFDPKRRNLLVATAADNGAVAKKPVKKAVKKAAT